MRHATTTTVLVIQRLCRLALLPCIFILFQFRTIKDLIELFAAVHELSSFEHVVVTETASGAATTTTTTLRAIDHHGSDHNISSTTTNNNNNDWPPLSSSSSSSSSTNAYAFIVAGCDPDNPRYRGFLYNILVAIYSLWSSGSKAEFVIMIQMAATTTGQYQELPVEDTAIFAPFNNNNNNNNKTIVHIKYMTKPKKDSFYQAMMSKFVILNLTQYNRVLFMDADVMPLCNLDYLFHLSDQGILKENVVIATSTEPANGGFFMVRPGPNDYSTIASIIKRQHDQVLQNESFFFDYDLGWGHVIQPPDEWVILSNKDPNHSRGRQWQFHGSFADQGLLYHWVKYVKMNVSIFVYSTIQNWAPPPLPPLSSSDAEFHPSMNKNEPVLEHNVSTFDISGLGCPVHYRFHPKRRPPPYKDFIHFSGNSKPWEKETIPDDLDNPLKATTPHVVWFHRLRKVNQEFHLNLNISSAHILTKHQPLLGRFPVMVDIVGMARADAAAN